MTGRIGVGAAAMGTGGAIAYGCSKGIAGR